MSEQAKRRGYFVDPNARYRISLKPFDGSDHWVDIQDELSEPDYRFVSDTMINIINDTSTRDPDKRRSMTLLDSRRHFIELLRRVIREWTLTKSGLMPGVSDPLNGDQPAEPMSLKRESFEMIGAVGEYLTKQIDKHYRDQRMTEEERGNSMPLLSAGTSEPAAVSDYLSEPSASWSQNGLESQSIEGTASHIA